MKKILSGCFVVMILQLFIPVKGFTQTKVLKLSLQDALEIARQQSLSAQNAKQTFRESFYQYRNFKGEYLPLLAFDAIAPQIIRSIQQYPYPDGTIGYIRQQTAEYQGSLSLTQQIGWTGGKISVFSNLQRIDNLADSTFSSYYSTPVYIGYTQPLFHFNPYKWEHKTKPLEYEQAKKKYLETIEEINIKTNDLFFNLLKSQLGIRIALSNLSYYDTLFKISIGRYQLGKIAENDLLKCKLSYLQAQAEVENSQIQFDEALTQFRSFLRINDSIELRVPEEIDFLVVDRQTAFNEAFKNSSIALQFRLDLLNAAMAVNQAKMDGRFDADLSVFFGLSQSAGKLQDVYKNPMDQQNASLNLSIPIYDWGVARGKIKIAQSKQEITKNLVDQGMIDFKSNVYHKVAESNIQNNQVRIAAISDTVARKNYEISKERYLAGKNITILELTQAQTDADHSAIGFYGALQSFWRIYFELRQMTLFDFRTNQPLQFDFKDIR